MLACDIQADKTRK